MPEDRENKSDLPVGTAVFATTHWSVVLAAGATNSPRAEAALGKLHRTYFYPLYAFVRRQGHGPHDAEDLLQEFFARLLERRDLETVRREKGRFRSFLLVSLKHCLINEGLRARTQKRGGGRALISLDEGC
jgi:RNA polymerase sigma-70 factor (ECF subfamily)